MLRVIDLCPRMMMIRSCKRDLGCTTKVPQSTDLYSKLFDSAWCGTLLLNAVWISVFAQYEKLPDVNPGLVNPK